MASLADRIGTSQRGKAYTITTGQTSKGLYWARIDSDTHYCAATSEESTWHALREAVSEAMFMIEDASA